MFKHLSNSRYREIITSSDISAICLNCTTLNQSLESIFYHFVIVFLSFILSTYNRVSLNITLTHSMK